MSEKSEYVRGLHAKIQALELRADRAEGHLRDALAVLVDARPLIAHERIVARIDEVSRSRMPETCALAMSCDWTCKHGTRGCPSKHVGEDPAPVRPRGRLTIPVKLLALAVVAIVGCGPTGIDGESEETGVEACERLDVAEVECEDGCIVRWSGSESWSMAVALGDVADLGTVDPSGMWECGSPDADMCVIVDGNGHAGCFRFDGDMAIPVAPTCALDDDPMWIDVGCETVARSL